VSDSPIDLNLPDAQGRFGQFGGTFVSETLMSALDDLTKMYEELSQSAEF